MKQEPVMHASAVGGHPIGRWALRLWPLALALLLVAPLMVSGGYPLGRDLIFVPHQPLTDAALGLTDGSPRAVPVDGFVALLTSLVDGGVLARVVLPLTLAGAAWGVAVLVRPLGWIAQVVASTFVVWNAYVVERLALGQWALLLAYAALPWLWIQASRFRRDGRPGDAAAALAWTGLASLTPTGGLFAIAGLVTSGWGSARRAAVLVAGGLVLQSPWVVAALTNEAAGTSDPAGVGAFAPDTQGPFGSWVAMLGAGGIWDAAAEPATRATWVAVVAAAAVVASFMFGWPVLRALWGRAEARRTAIFAGGFAVVAFASATPLGQQVLRGLVDTVPGAGLLRDGQKFLAPAVLLAGAALGAAAARLTTGIARMELEVRVATLLPVVLAPLVLLPDATTVTWPTVAPVHYPGAYDAVANAVDVSNTANGDSIVVTLPWRSYRAFAWTGKDLTSSDPAARWLDANVVTSDSLQVGDALIAGESTYAAEVERALEAGPTAEALRALGVSWVLVYPDDPEAERIDVSGLVPVVADATMDLYRVPEPDPDAYVSPAHRMAVVGAHLTALGLWLCMLVISVSTILVRWRGHFANRQQDGR